MWTGHSHERPGVSHHGSDPALAARGIAFREIPRDLQSLAARFDKDGER